MAASGARNLKKNVVKTLDIDYDGVFQTQTRSKIVKDILIFIMNQRQLIPVSYQHLKDDINSWNKRLKESEQRKTRLNKDSREQKKKESLVLAVDEIFEALEGMFIYGGPVEEVIISLGSTVVSPKELYKLQFPTTFHEGSALSLKQCSSLLFRQLVASDFLGDCPVIKPTSKLTVLLRAPRKCETASRMLTPKLTYKEPSRCHKYVINFRCRAPVSNADLSTIGDFDFNMSGIEPLEKSVTQTPVPDFKRFSLPSLNKLTRTRASESSFKASSEDITVAKSASSLENGIDQLHNRDSISKNCQITEASVIPVIVTSESLEDDYIWYQVPVTLTGYVAKIDKKASANGMFLV